jgi:transcriptional regulator of acetoin/glycerol metabolism
MTKKDLEATVKEKVKPLVEESLEKNLGVTIPKLEEDITDQLKKPIMDIYIPPHLNFKDAKKAFKKEFLKRELKLHLGNISHLAKSLGLDRRSIHRTIKDLHIDIKHVRGEDSKGRYYEHKIDEAIRTTLDTYKDVIHPTKMESMYQDVASLSRNIAKTLPHQHLRWKDAEHVFEKEFLEKALKDEGSVTKAAKKIDIAVETFHRKIKKLRLR